MGEKYCIVCGNPQVQMHHIFFGTANRKIADRYGYVVPLCFEHHIGNSGVHFDRGLDLMLKRNAQMDFENTHTRQEFIATFGKSYL